MSDEADRMVQEMILAGRPRGVLVGYVVMRDTDKHIASAYTSPAVCASGMFGPSRHANEREIPRLLAEARREAFREAARAQAHADLDADKNDYWCVYWVAEVRRAGTAEDGSDDA